MVSAAIDSGIAEPRGEDFSTLPAFDPFRVLTPAERREQLDGYREFLRRRDGAMSFEAGTLSEREAYFAELDTQSVVWEGDADIDGFYQHLHKVGRPELDPRTTWLLAVAKANQMESFGVEGELQKWRLRGYAGEDEIVLYDLLEEHYHTRILIEVCRTAGLGAVRLGRPDAFIRGMIYIMQRFPDQLRYIPVTCGEVMACVVFQTLLENCHLFSQEPAVRARLESLCREILTDETGHVLYCRAHLSPTGLRIAKRLIPLISRFLLKDVPELRALGLDDTTLASKMASGIPIPSEFDFIEPDLA
jgi:hypothetical protein